MQNLIADSWIQGTTLEGSTAREIGQYVLNACEQVASTFEADSEERALCQMLQRGFRGFLELQQTLESLKSDFYRFYSNDQNIKNLVSFFQKKIYSQISAMMGRKEEIDAVWIPIYSDSDINHFTLALFVRKPKNKLDFIYINTGATSLSFERVFSDGKMRQRPFFIQDILFSDALEEALEPLAKNICKNFAKVFKKDEQFILNEVAPLLFKQGGRFVEEWDPGNSLHNPYASQKSGTCSARAIVKAIKNLCGKRGFAVVSALKLHWLKEFHDKTEKFDAPQNKLIIKLCENYSRRIKKLEKQKVFDEAWYQSARSICGKSKKKGRIIRHLKILRHIY